MGLSFIWACDRHGVAMGFVRIPNSGPVLARCRVAKGDD